MIDRSGGGPAFPVVSDTEHDSGYHSTVDSSGMTLRDYFAAKAINRLMRDFCAPWGQLVTQAYDMADAMIAEKRRREAKP